MIVPEPVAVRVMDDEAVREAASAIESVVPEPCSVIAVPLRAPVTVIIPLLFELVSWNVLTVEALSVTAAALSTTETLPPVLAASVPAAVLTVRDVGVPARARVAVLGVLLTVTEAPVVLAVRLVTSDLTLRVAALPARVREAELAELSTYAVPEVLAVMLVVVVPVVMY